MATYSWSPRYPDCGDTPCLEKPGSAGTAPTFPDNGWDTWMPCDDGRDSFVYFNSVHICQDDTVGPSIKAL
jgi:hypothetical protein